jgi:hypothetical protein
VTAESIEVFFCSNANTLVHQRTRKARVSSYRKTKADQYFVGSAFNQYSVS